VRVATKGTHPSPGDEVQVSKRDGSTDTVKLGAIVDRDNGAFPGPAVYYRKATNGKRRGRGAQAPARAPQAVLPELSSTLFSWHADEKVFAADASDIRLSIAGGLVLVSAK